MEELKELVYILSFNKTKKIRQYGFLQDETGRLLEFYKGLVDQKWSTDEEAAQALLNVPAKHKTYRRLKNNLKEELLNAFLFLDVTDGSYTNFQKSYYENYKKLAQFYIVKGKSAKKTAYELGKKVLKKAIDFDFTTIVLEVARSLRKTNAAYFGNEKEHEYYSVLIDQYLKILNLEIKAETSHTSIARFYAKSKATKNHIFDQFIEDYKQFSPYLGIVDSHNFNINGYLTGVNLYMSINDYKMTSQICQQAIKYFENRHYNHRVAKLIFLYQYVVCTMQLARYEEGKIAIEKCYQLVKNGEHDWFRTLENHLLLCLYTSEFDKAWELFQTAKKSKGFKHLLPTVKERWVLHEAYIYFLLEIKKIEISSNPSKKFRVSKFLNSVPPAYSQDKRGLNIPILIIQVLFLWNHNKFDDAYQRIEALLKYNSRHLKKEDGTYRTECFIKMLEIAAKNGFQPNETRKRVEKYAQLLNEAEIVIANQSAEIEYIPYHILWKFGLEILDRVHAK